MTKQTTEITQASGGAPAAMPTAGSTTPARLLELAITQGASIESLEKLLELQERWEANEARKEYARAIAAFKAEAPEIKKDARVDFTSSKGRTQYNHASLPGICRAVDPVLAKFGLGYSWETEQANGGVMVRCRVFHSAGHSESVSLQSAPDASGGKNSIQAIGSAVSYLQRYTLLAALGLAAGEDDDGQAAGNPVQAHQEAPAQHQEAPATNWPPLAPHERKPLQDCISGEQIELLDKTLMAANWSRDKFCAAAGIQAINQLSVHRFGPAMARINQENNRNQGA